MGGDLNTNDTQFSNRRPDEWIQINIDSMIFSNDR